MESGVATPPVELVTHPRARDIEFAPKKQQRFIGWLYGGTGLAVIFLMAILGLVMRANQGGVIDISDDFFYRIMTMHGAGMIVAAQLTMMGGIWYVMRETVQLDFHRMLVSYGLFLVGSLTVIVSVLIGGFSAAWTFLSPLPFDAQEMWPLWSTMAFLLGFVLVGIGFLLFCTDLILQTLRQYGGISRSLGVKYLRGRDDNPPPPTVLAGLAVGIQGVVAVGMGVPILIALLTRAVDEQTAINALWAKNLTYMFGHSFANVTIYLAAGMLYTLLPRYAGRPWKTSKPIVVGWLATVVIVLAAYPHHLYMDFAQPAWASGIGMVISSAAALPVAVVTIYTGMMLIWGSNYRWTLASSLLFLGFAGWAIGGVGAVIDSLIPVNFKLHNTLWVPAHFHTYMALGVVLWSLALIMHLFERAADRVSSRLMTWLAPTSLLVGGYGLVGVWYVAGALGVPRRYSNHFGDVDIYSTVATAFAALFILGLMLVFAEYFQMWRAMRAKKRGLSAALAGGVALDADDAARLTGGVAISSGEMTTAIDNGRSGGNGGGSYVDDPAIEPSGFARAGSPATVAARMSEFSNLLTTRRQLTICIAAAAVFFVTFLPAVNNVVDESASWHHLQHAGQFLYGLLLAVAIASTPTFSAKLRWRSINTAIAAWILMPTIMLIMMIPNFYSTLEDDRVLHLGYHLAIVFTGFITGLAVTAFDRFTGWFYLIVAASMAVLYAAGVGLV